MTLLTTFERFDTTSGTSQKFTPEAVSVQDRRTWSGLKLERWEGEAQEMAEAVLPEHFVIVNIGAPVSGEMRWSGHHNSNRPLASKHIAIIPAQMPYRALSTSYSTSLILSLRPDYLRSIARAWSADVAELQPAYNVDDGLIAHAALALAEDVRARHPLGAIYGESLQAMLAAHLLSRYASKSNATPRADLLGGKLKLRERILDQLENDLRLADLANELEMDVSTFVRWFRKAFGAPPHQFILRERIARAKVLLRTSDQSLIQIALQCGFGSHSHFSTQFKRVVGVQPGRYRLEAGKLPIGR